MTLQGFTINGGAGVSCGSASVCYLTRNTIQGGEIGVFSASRAFLESNVIQNGDRGSTVSDGSQLFSSNDIFQGNGQGLVAFVAYVEASNSSFLNNGLGILASASNLRLLGATTISGSGGDGMALRAGSISVFQGATITGNGGDGVHLEDASFAGFQSATVTGNLSGLERNCAPQFTITHFVARTGGVKTTQPAIKVKSRGIENQSRADSQMNLITTLVAPGLFLLHCNPMRARRPGRERVIEIHIEAFVQFQMIFVHIDHMHMMIAFQVNFAEVVFIQKVVDDNQPFVIVGERNRVWACIRRPG